jgi:hypothetical protein
MSSNGGPTSFALSCPAPLATTDRVLLGHGSGGKMTADLIARSRVAGWPSRRMRTW